MIRVRRGNHPDLIVRLPDGSHAAITVSMTDYGRAADAPAQPLPNYSLLDLENLRELARLIDHFHQ